MTVAFAATTPASGECAWRVDERPGYRGGARAPYVADAVIQTEAGSNLTTEAGMNFTTE
ncbi:hypothetical protein [Denitrobaculum tricleocarpae]|uniref:hypothetical protein n=1 Tax=Denitrobaculum tricleocarpae TaxID=2591009 RepID=UPI0015D45B58|nr:hypothetical protein [Denitrobaculum tricleocarpae]